ncbi:MAG TPA: hypothetical protein VGP31_09490 [Planosporangium sp.]|jgi:hypothetical protein|nr:hypothetical protein [Planosporangium sp.]
MRALALVLALAVTLLVVACAVAVVSALGRRDQRRLRQQARWRLRHYGDRGETVVAVSLTSPAGRVLDEHVVARVPDGVADWTERFLLAKETAEERAFHLNAAGNDPPPSLD